MDAEYEKNYHLMEQSNWWFKARRQLVLHHLVKLKPQRILDVGCSAGATMDALKVHGFSEIYGIDISEKAVEKCRLRKLNAFVESAEKTSFENNFFDAIIASDVLEHTSSDWKTFNEWYRILKPKGHILLFVPAFMHLWSAHDDMNHHRKRYQLSEIVRIAEKYGFLVKTATYWNFALYFPRLFALRFKDQTYIRTTSFQPKNAILNNIFYVWLSFENTLIKSGMRFPFGISCFVILEKP